MPYPSENTMTVEQSFHASISDSSTLDEHEQGRTEKPESDQTSLVAWFELAALCGLASSCSLMWLSFSAVTDISVKWLDVNITAVSWLGNATALMYIFTSLITGWFFEKFGVKNSVCISFLTPEC
jgi:hypothetical protein